MNGETLESELDRLYADLDAEIAAASPRCDASGRCCRFAEYGHTLFLSRVEAQRLLAPGVPDGQQVDRESCPYQVGRLCVARDRRPIGCRVYFCDPTFAERQVELSEKYLGRLKAIHRARDLDWEYAPLHHFLEIELPEKINGFHPNRLSILNETT